MEMLELNWNQKKNARLSWNWKRCMSFKYSFYFKAHSLVPVNTVSFSTGFFFFSHFKFFFFFQVSFLFRFIVYIIYFWRHERPWVVTRAPSSGDTSTFILGRSPADSDKCRSRTLNWRWRFGGRLQLDLRWLAGRCTTHLCRSTKNPGLWAFGSSWCSLSSGELANDLRLHTGKADRCTAQGGKNE